MLTPGEEGNKSPFHRFFGLSWENTSQSLVVRWCRSVRFATSPVTYPALTIDYAAAQVDDPELLDIKSSINSTILTIFQVLLSKADSAELMLS